MTYPEFIKILTRLQEFHLEEGEPIPDLSYDCIDKVKSVLDSPFHGIYEQEFYPTFEEKAAVLFYNFCKGHPLANGNKRAAIEVLDWFCFKNLMLLHYTNSQLRELALKIVNSNAQQHKEVVAEITESFKQRTIQITFWWVLKVLLVMFVRMVYPKYRPKFLIKRRL